MPENFIITALRDWWQLLLAAFGLWGSYRVGTERQRWRVDEIGKAMEALNARVAALESQGKDEAVAVAAMMTTQRHIVETLGLIRGDLHDIHHEMRGKADK